MNSHGILGDEWMVSYASGALSEAHALVVASHCDFHPELQQKVREAEDIGGALLENYQPTEISNKLFDDLLDKIDNSSKIDISSPSNDNFGLPASLANYLGKPL